MATSALSGTSTPYSADEMSGDSTQSSNTNTLGQLHASSSFKNMAWTCRPRSTAGVGKTTARYTTSRRIHAKQRLRPGPSIKPTSLGWSFSKSVVLIIHWHPTHQCTRAFPISSPSAPADTAITLPSSISPASSFLAIGSTRSFWMTRFSGRAPYTGS